MSCCLGEVLMADIVLMWLLILPLLQRKVLLLAHVHWMLLLVVSVKSVVVLMGWCLVSIPTWVLVWVWTHAITRSCPAKVLRLGKMLMIHGILQSIAIRTH